MLYDPITTEKMKNTMKRLFYRKKDKVKDFLAETTFKKSSNMDFFNEQAILIVKA